MKGLMRDETRHSGIILIAIVLISVLLLSACQGAASGLEAGAQVVEAAQPDAGSQSLGAELEAQAADTIPTPYPTRPLYAPGELVDYTAQAGDTLPVLAARFNTTTEQILEANSFIPSGATTMPPGMPMKIPIYYQPLWGSPYQILPDSLFVNGPAQLDFDSRAFISQHPGWLASYRAYAAGATRDAAGIIDYVALRYSVSPRLLLALIEYQAGGLSDPVLLEELEEFPLGYRAYTHRGLYLQLNWAANLLNNGYYAHRAGRLMEIERPSGRISRLDPWQNPATVSLHNYFNQLLVDDGEFGRAISPDGFAATYQELFGDPWLADQPHIPGSLTQPEFNMPFERGETWAFTGGSHSPWGVGEPLAALDFAPPDIRAGSCQPSSHPATAVAAGTVARSETGVVVLDLDGDGDERTGWVVFYLHLANEKRAEVGDVLEAGQRVGYPSCVGGTSTGTHIHIARKYNGEWVQAEGALAFNLEGWLAFNGSEQYQGTLVKEGQVVRACVCSDAESFIVSAP
jgi:murein DD-endopeptidase MepM/ murein hydrolase activator NlpD